MQEQQEQPVQEELPPDFEPTRPLLDDAAFEDGLPRKPILISRLLMEQEVDTWRHHHCTHYEDCLTQAAAAIHGQQSWVCALRCPCRTTFREYPQIVPTEWLKEKVLS